MNVYRKNLIVQLLLFIIFIVMGAYTIVEFYLRADYPWIGFILLGLLLSVGVYGFYLYRKPDQRVCIITEKEMLYLRYLLYGYFIVYVIDMILPSIIQTINQGILTLITGILLILIAMAGTIIQLRVLRTGKGKE
jgi:hypothetical protein